MSDQDAPAEVKAADSEKPAESPKDDAQDSARKGTLIIGLAILASLVWYLLADRYTPYTSQARVEGYVVGVAPEVSGVVTRVGVSNNQSVEKDQVLFEIDPAQYEIALKKAQSDLANARSQVDAGSAGVDTARANLEAARANELKARQDYQRLKRLHEEDPGTVSVRRLEISKASLDAAGAKVSAARSEIRRAIESKGGEDDDENAILKLALSAVEKAELDLTNTVVKAPARGIVTDLRTDAGQYAGTGKPVMTLIAIHDVWINAAYTENNLGHLRPGTRVEIIFDAVPGHVFDGEVRSVGLGISAGQAPPAGTLPTVQNSRDWLRQAQRFPVVIEFATDQDEDLQKQLRVGAQASVIAYSEGSFVLGLLGKLYIRLMSLLSYVY